ncbi:MAG TPA: triose-phosphate isomerase [Tissierellia bacterium]|nr:triose-phosphate isomerase [Tissierellia bacterium]
MRRQMIAGNWKMNKTLAEAGDFLKELQELEPKQPARVVVCAPYLSLPMLAEESAPPVEICAQNVHFAPSGAYTGEVSFEMLKDIGVHLSIIGHSERREYFNETDESLNKKVQAAINEEFEVILCCGEKLEEREADRQFEVVENQLRADLAGVAADDMYLINIAYEPVWAIGTGRTASAEDAQAMCQHIRQLLVDLFDETVADETTILYGGSVKPDNIAELMAMKDIDGALVGGASLQPESFKQLLDYEAK